MLPPLPDTNILTAPAVAPKRKAAIIDDAFDDVEAGEISVVQYLEFYQVANEDEAFDQLVAELKLTLPDVQASEDPPTEFLEFLQELWKHRRTNARLRELVDAHLFVDKVGKLNELESICRNLEGSDLEVSRINSRVADQSIFTSGEFVYIFIDYNLGIQPGAEAVANARAKAREIYNKCPKGKKPVTILMSSEAGVASLIDRFQEEAGMLEGVFRFSPKEQLRDQHKFSLLIRAYTQEFESNHVLQEYIQTLTKAAKSALSEFEKEVQTLRIEDYVFIQNSALRDEAQPLGDYLAWLYGTHWANLLLRNADLRAQQAIIDKVFSEKPPLHHRLPSPKVSDIYMSALFEEGLGPVELHPLEGTGNGHLAKLPYLHLGDLFTKPGALEVWMVLNAQCDLERPDEKNADRSIFLVRGVLTPFDKAPVGKEQKTDFFSFEDKQYRIKWNVKQVETVAHNKFTEWQKEKELERHFRLRLPFALEIQQAFSASLTRVGMPVSPPFTQGIALEVLFRNEDNSASKFLALSTEYAFLPVTREGNKLARLTLHFALDFKEALLAKQRALEDEVAALSGGHPSNYLRKTRANIDSLLGKFDDWFFDKPGFAFPSTTKASPHLLPNLIGLTIDAAASPIPAPLQFVINIITTNYAPVELLSEPGIPLPPDEN
jgi:hypothetical protein